MSNSIGRTLNFSPNMMRPPLDRVRRSPRRFAMALLVVCPPILSTVHRSLRSWLFSFGMVSGGPVGRNQITIKPLIFDPRCTGPVEVLQTSKAARSSFGFLRAATGSRNAATFRGTFLHSPVNLFSSEQTDDPSLMRYASRSRRHRHSPSRLARTRLARRGSLHSPKGR
jgi:hypothetical protein